MKRYMRDRRTGLTDAIALQYSSTSERDGVGGSDLFFSSLTVRNASYILRKSVRVCGLRISLLQEKKKKKSLV